MKRLLAIALSFFMLFACLPVMIAAETGGDIGLLQWRFADGVLTVSGEGGIADFLYPDQNAPWADLEIHSVVIEEGVTTVGNWAFSRQAELTDVTLAEGVTHIGSYAFALCPKLKNVSLPDSLYALDMYAFYQDTALERIRLGDGLAKIGAAAFSGCTALADVTLPDRPIYMDNMVFDNTAYLKNDANWQNGLLLIGNHLIKAKTDLNGTVTVPAGTRSIASSAFLGCTGLTEIDLGGVQAIGRDAFSGCRQLRRVDVPEGVTRLEEGTFNMCDALDEVSLPDSLAFIGPDAFANDPNLYRIDIPANVETIDPRAFTGSSLITVAVAEDNGYYRVIGGMLFNGDATELILCPAGRQTKSYVVPDTVKTIGSYAFAGHTELTRVILPDGLERIENNAFEDCWYLTELILPETVTYIGDYAFAMCGRLQNVYQIYIPAATVEISPNAFADCPVTGISGMAESYAQAYALDHALPYVAVEAPVTPTVLTGTVGELSWRLEGDTLTISGTGDMPDFSDGVTPWQGYGFTKLVIEEGVTSIGNTAFYHADDLQQATLPDSLTRLGRSAFAQCGMLTDVQIPDGVTVIEMGAFRVCQSLQSIVIPDGVTTIEYFAFENCSAMESIIIPASVTAILEDMVFVDCDALTIYGYTGSYAEQYADENGIPFAALDENGEPDYSAGNPDGEGEITAADALMALQAATGKITLTDAQKSAADVDGNGDVSAADALAILQFATGKITSFASVLDPEKTVALAVPAGSPYARRADGNGGDARITAAMDAAEKELGITFVAKEYASGEEIPAADLVVAPIWRQQTLAPAGTLRDLNTVEGLDLTAAGWDQTALRDIRVYGKNFVAVPSLTGPKESAGVIYFNKTLAEQVDTSADELYQLVQNGEWTFAKMREFSAKALRDIDGVPGIDYSNRSGKDQYGFTGVNMRGNVSYAIVKAQGAVFAAPAADGGFTYKLGEGKGYNALNQMQKWLLGDKSIFNPDRGGNNPAIGAEIFKDGRALFLGWTADKAETFADMRDEWGVLPYPTNVTGGSYTAVADWNAQGFSIPKQTAGAALDRAVAALNVLAAKLEEERTDRAAQRADLFDEQTPAMLAIAADRVTVGAEQFVDLGAGGMATVQYLFDDLSRDPAQRIAAVEEDAAARLAAYLKAVK